MGTAEEDNRPKPVDPPNGGGETGELAVRSRQLADLKAALDEHAIVAITDAAGRITYANDKFCEVSRWSRSELLGRDHRIINSGFHPRSFFTHMWDTIRAGRVWKGEIRNRAKDGAHYWVDTTIVPFLGEDGAPVQYIAIRADITERKEAEAARDALEAQLRESQKLEALGSLAGGVAHDFNNLLATMFANFELARQIRALPPQAEERLAEIEKAASQAHHLVKQILAFSRSDPPRFAPVSLAEIVDDVRDLLRASLPASAVLEIHGDRSGRVLADAGQMKQVVLNLADNAVRALSGHAGRVAIRADLVSLEPALLTANPALLALAARGSGRAVRLEVSDNGGGMDEETRQRAFEPFFTTRRVNEGTGLGLSVVHGIVKAHHGVVVIDSEPGRGSTFTVYLPAAEDPKPAAVAGTISATRPVGDRSPARLAFIDDNAALLNTICLLLRQRGYDVIGYEDPRPALEAFRADPARFDLVVTDQNMPAMPGLDLVSRLRDARRDLPAGILSGFIDESLRRRALELGVQELIPKGDLADLYAAVARLARSAPRLRA